MPLEQLTVAAVIAAYVLAVSFLLLRLPPTVALAGVAALVAAATVALAAFTDAPLFSVAKLYSVAFAAIVAFAYPLAGRRAADVLAWVVPTIIALNIAELVISEYGEGFLLNPLAGVMLILTLPGPRAVSTDRSGTALHYDIGWLRIVAYSVWGFVGVYNHSHGESTLFAAVHIGAALLLCLGDQRRYFTARVTSLTAIMAYRMFVDLIPWTYRLQDAFLPALSTVASGLSLALALAVAWMRIGELGRPARRTVA